MTDTDLLVDQLAKHATPVRRLASPLRRTALWMLLATIIISMVVASFGARPGWLQDMLEPKVAIEWFGSLLTGALAAYAVFQISVPGRSPSWAWLPLPAVVLWLGGIGLGCLHDVGRIGSNAFIFESHSVECALAITLTSLPLCLVMLLMVRHAGVVRPAPTAMLTALSAAALSSAGVSMIHEGETALMVLLWHGGAVVLLSASSWLFGRHLFAWIGYARR